VCTQAPPPRFAPSKKPDDERSDGHQLNQIKHEIKRIAGVVSDVQSQQPEPKRLGDERSALVGAEIGKHDHS
jgi:hypothetical protein